MKSPTNANGHGREGQTERRAPAYIGGSRKPSGALAPAVIRIDCGLYSSCRSCRSGAAMVDAHVTCSVREAQRFAHKVADCDLGWFEEPVNADDKAGQSQVRVRNGYMIIPDRPGLGVMLNEEFVKQFQITA